MSDPLILVVDDSKVIRKVVAKAAQESYPDCEVVMAENGETGALACEEHTFDLIITDRNMPEMDGIGFIKQVRSMAKYEKTPIIMVTTESRGKYVREGLIAGANDYIVKPFEKVVIRKKIERWMKADVQG